jgi:5S rRNA maturation endonuclease (ribonuclease M5)
MRRRTSRDDYRIDMMADAITEISELSSNGVPILVEGKRDEEALKAIGVRGRIIRVRQYRKKLFELSEELSSYKSIIILTDFDKEGEDLAEKIERQLHMWGVQTIMREKVRSAVSWATRQIEGLNKVKGMQEKLNNKQFIMNSS